MMFTYVEYHIIWGPHVNRFNAQPGFLVVFIFRGSGV